MFDKEIYTERRKKLIEHLQSGVILLLGNGDSPMNYRDNVFPFRQDSTFLYFFGLDFQGLAGILDADNGEEMIFGDDPDLDDIIWMGPQIPVGEKAARVGVSTSLPFKQLAVVVAEALQQGRKVHFLPPYRAENKLILREVLGISTERLSSYASVDLIKGIVALRSVKEPCEIKEMRAASDIGSQMHLTAMNMTKPGSWEQAIAGTIDAIPLSMGGMPAYPTILSQHGEILHNHSHHNHLEEGKLLLIDAGAENRMHYASDFTRTLPVAGRFSQQQREIYEVVLAANDAAFNLTKAGITYLEVHLAVAKLMVSGLKALGLMKGDATEAVNQGAHALFMPHGLGHMIGLDVHDMEDLGQIYVGYDDETRPVSQFGTASLRLGRKLQPGFTLTNEPGIYFIPALIDKWRQEKISAGFINFEKLESYRNFGGIRLEDNLLVTATGCELLGTRIPVTPEDVERTMN